MNKKQRLQKMLGDLKALKSRIEADDKEAIEEADKLKSEIAELKSEIELEEKKASVLELIGCEPGEDVEEKSGIAALDLGALKEQKGSAQTYIKAATDTVTGPTIPGVSERIVVPQQQLSVRDLFAQERVSVNSLTYFVMGAVEGTPAVTAEGAQKPQIHPTYTSKTEALVKIAAFLKETDELLSDAPFLESAVRGRGIQAVRAAVESYLITKLLGTSGIDVTVNSGISFDNILKAKMAVKRNTGFNADAIVINPTDLQALLLTKDSNNQYMMGGPAYAPYGNGQYGAYLPIWGMTVVESSEIAAGTAIVGAFKTCGSVIGKDNEGFRVEFTNSNEDDFEHNMVTIRIEERILEAIRMPGGFAKVYTADDNT